MPTHEEIIAAVKTLLAAGWPVVPQEHLTIDQLCAKIGVKRTWVRTHLHEFPNRWRLSGACGEWRFPVSDVDAYTERRRVFSRKLQKSEVLA